MKITVAILTFCIGVSFAYLEPGAITAENFGSTFKGAESLRSEGVYIPEKGELLDFCYVSSIFNQKHQTCGCTIYDEYHVITPASCVIE